MTESDDSVAKTGTANEPVTVTVNFWPTSVDFTKWVDDVAPPLALTDSFASSLP